LDEKKDPFKVVQPELAPHMRGPYKAGPEEKSRDVSFLYSSNFFHCFHLDVRSGMFSSCLGLVFHRFDEKIQ
jgi:hypothetical protein